MKRYLIGIIFIILTIIGIGLYHFDIAPFSMWNYNWDGENEGTYDALILSKNKDTKYTRSYIAEVNGKKLILYIPIELDVLNIGDIVRFEGEFKKPSKERNDGTFNYELYLKTLGISGGFYAQNIEKLGINYSLNLKIECMFETLRENVSKNFDQNLSKDNASLLKALIIGDKSNIEKDVIDYFRDSSLSHIIAISGTHFTLVTGCLIILFKRIKKKRLGQVLTIVLAVFYMFLAKSTPSIIRAGIMCISLVLSSMCKREYKFFNSLFLSSIIMQFQNPYIIFNMSYLFSFGGTLGIVLFFRFIHRRIKSTIFCMTLSANLAVMPLTMYNFNTFSLSFIVSNFGAAILISPIVILGFISGFIPFKPFYIVLDVLLKLLSIWANFCSKLPLSKIYIPKVSVISIIIFYIMLIIISKKWKDKEKYLRRKIVAIFSVFIIIFNLNYTVFSLKITKDLLINFIDVGQGDSCMIRINDKTILVDSGGTTSLDSAHDVGENITLPYVLGQKVNMLDYILISHFDADHVEGFIAILESIKVKNIILSKQPKESFFYKKVLNIAKEKNINLIYVKMGDTLNIDKNLKFIVLWPGEEFVGNEDLNNNAIVFKLEYGNSFSMLFTGDVEKIGEEKLLSNLKKFDYLKILKSDILKVGHHGSKTSTTDKFLDAVSPKIALIGVGENNKFGHPNDEIIEKLKNKKIKIYRTDLSGEIKIRVRINGAIKIKTKL